MKKLTYPMIIVSYIYENGNSSSWSEIMNYMNSVRLDRQPKTKREKNWGNIYLSAKYNNPYICKKIDGKYSITSKGKELYESLKNLIESQNLDLYDTVLIKRGKSIKSGIVCGFPSPGFYNVLIEDGIQCRVKIGDFQLVK